MALIRQGRVAENEWSLASTAEEIPPLGPLYVTPALWAEAREKLLQSGRPLGLWLKSDQRSQDLADDIRHFQSIALEFPKFTDGRAYTAARILRERLGFSGELRAVGQVLRDQLLFMQFSLAYGLFVSAVLILGGRYLVPLFNDDPQVVETGVLYFWIVPLCYAGYAVVMMSAAVFNALGRPWPASALTVTRALGLYVPLSFLGSALFGMVTERNLAFGGMTL